MLKFHFQIIGSFLIFLALTHATFACTRVLSSKNDKSVIVARTMDWYQDMNTDLIIYPRETQREGMAKINSMRWQAKYGSIAATVFNAMTTDGMNEHGFAAHILWLDEANYGKSNKKTQHISVAMWAQFYLDNFKTVDEAVRFTKTKPFQIEPLFYPGTQNAITVHLALEDAGGDSAIIEYINGVAHIYHDPNYKVLTNSPSLEQQLKNLQQYIGFGGDKPLPGTTASPDRFVRASYYVNRLPKAQTAHNAITMLLGVVQNIAEPYGIPTDEQSEIEPTLWRTVADLTNLTYYFNSSTSFGFIWVDLKEVDFKPGAQKMRLDLINHSDLFGNVTKKFKPLK